MKNLFVPTEKVICCGAEMVSVLYSGSMYVDIAKEVWGRCQQLEGGSVHSAICSVIPRCQDGPEGILNAEKTMETEKIN